MALFLEDDNVAVPGFYQFAKQAIQHYHFTSENYDPRVFGFNMQHQVRQHAMGHVRGLSVCLSVSVCRCTMGTDAGTWPRGRQHMIPGRYPKKPSELLPPDTLYYKYQLLSTWGPIFFPAHWSEFVTWYAERSSSETFLPLFSNMVTNDWFMKVRPPLHTHTQP
jgi:hypothetical protein